MKAFTVSIPVDLQSLIDPRLAEGVCVDVVGRHRLKARIAEGLTAGIDEREPEDVLAEIIDEDPKLRG